MQTGSTTSNKQKMLRDADSTIRHIIMGKVNPLQQNKLFCLHRRGRGHSLCFLIWQLKVVKSQLCAFNGRSILLDTHTSVFEDFKGFFHFQITDPSTLLINLSFCLPLYQSVFIKKEHNLVFPHYFA